MSLEVKYYRERDVDGNLKKVSLEQDNIPPFLLSPARGSFPFIEEHLAQRSGFSIPESWQVQHMIAAVAVASARLVGMGSRRKESDEIRVELILDDSTIKSKVNIAGKIVHCRIFTPDTRYDYVYDEKRFYGLPNWVYPEGGYPSGVVGLGDFVDRKGNLLEDGSKFFDLLAQEISQTPTSISSV